ncbi:hypothetical protein EUTSA_v10026978mg [Eutrema salsugineum]|uniref:Uncharacterized protein n=1 Tax=Eutrema salsugineum TaxID=72664 RepID=V4LWW3_EUTSA|nr:putative defensin-like protein 234 [Eutrema salsugineum]ESQ55145.1 hypothetical protein EUTSA_v10026978mg [Eutrema salsugineum]
MRSATLFLFSCILMSFILNHVKEVEGGLTPMELCGRKDIFIGGCSQDGNNTCINDFVKKGGDANRPSSCECDTCDEQLCRCISLLALL